MSTPSTTCSLSLVLSRDATVGAIFRRGPSKWVRLIKWETDRDRFEFGQWLHGKIYADRCDVSPDGELLLYFGGSFKQSDVGRGIYSAVSRLPYFTALALWPQGDCWGGGGSFVDNFTVLINTKPIPLPRKRNKRDPSLDASMAAATVRLREVDTRGWIQEISDDRTHARYTKPQPNGDARIVTEIAGHTMATRALTHSGDELVSLNDSAIRDWDHRGRLIHSRGGELFATTIAKSRTVETKRLFDFTDMRFEEVPPPPHATEW